MQLARAHVLISGRVQGVLFRVSARRKAKQLNITGWVQNLPSGQVEAVFEGQEDKVRRIINWARRGPIFAKVDNLEVVWQDYQGEFTDFKIKYGGSW